MPQKKKDGATMIRGCQKRIIYLRSTDSGIFDEAYFVIKHEYDFEGQNEADMVSEAKRILDGASYRERDRSKKKKHLVYFSLGALAATGFFALLGLVITAF